MKGLRAYDAFLAAPGMVHRVASGVSLATAQSVLRGKPIFIVDDAVECLRETVTASGGGMASDTIPLGAIPFPVFWMEWAMKADMTADLSPGEWMRVGAFCQHAVVPAVSAPRLMIYPFFCGEVNGRIIVDPGVEAFGASPRSDGGAWDVESYQFCEPGIDDSVSPFSLLAVLFSLALLTTKNVVRTEAGLPRHVRRHSSTFAGTVGDKHYTLDIPGASSYKNSVNGADDAQRKRLHIVRGHFADYSEGGGLFGKLHGRYYIAPHVRGSAERGTVTKDYNVRASA
jgi:hypothetical protein